jgi:hypothetical protein
MKSPLRRFALVFAAVLAVSLATFLPMCNLLFSCGCTVSGASHCNIHHAAGPMCPWCSHGSALAIAYAATLLAAAGSIFASLKHRITRGRLIAAFVCGVVGYAVTLSLVGLTTALYFHNPTWYGLHLIDRRL